MNATLNLPQIWKLFVLFYEVQPHLFSFHECNSCKSALEQNHSYFPDIYYYQKNSNLLMKLQFVLSRCGKSDLCLLSYIYFEFSLLFKTSEKVRSIKSAYKHPNLISSDDECIERIKGETLKPLFGDKNPFLQTVLLPLLIRNAFSIRQF